MATASLILSVVALVTTLSLAPGTAFPAVVVGSILGLGTAATIIMAFG